MELMAGERTTALDHAERAVGIAVDQVSGGAHLEAARLTVLAARARRALSHYLRLFMHRDAPDAAEVERAFTLQLRVSGLVSGMLARRRAWLERNRPDLHEQIHRRVVAHGSIRPSDLLATPEELAAAALHEADAALGAGDVAARLQPHDALIQFVLASGPDAGGDAERYAAFVIRPGHAPSFVALAPAEETQALVEGLERALRAYGGRRDLDAPEAPEEDRAGGDRPAAELRRLLWGPLRALVGDARTVFIVPDGALYRLPFGALVEEDGSRLAERHGLVHLTTAAHWRDFGTKDSRPAAPPVVIAEPAYDLMPRARHQPPVVTGPFRPLAGAQREGEQVAGMLGVELQGGASARIGELACARSPEILHLATHGFAEQDVPYPGGARAETGVALAGVNDVLAGRDVPGDAGRCILDQDEVMTLDLARTDVVVLSACSTAGGSLEEGEGVSGLVRAFLVAGARSVVATLWPVDDEGTREWMAAFYRALLAGATRIDAMASARDALSASHPGAPGFWSPFVLFGDPGPLVRFTDLPAGRQPALEIHGRSVVRRLDIGGDQLSVAVIPGLDDPSDPPNAEARDAQSRGDHQRALEIVQRILADPEMAPGHARARNTQGFSHLGRNEPGDALLAFTAGLYLAPGPALRASLLYGRGTGRMQAGDPLGATADFDRVIPLYAGDDTRASHALNNRGNAHWTLGAWEAATADANAVLALAGAPADQVGFAHALVGRVEQACGRPAPAAAAFRQAARAGAGTEAEPHAALCLAALHLETGELDEAAGAAQRALRHGRIRDQDRVLAERVLERVSRSPH